MRDKSQSKQQIQNAKRIVLFGASGMGNVFLSEFKNRLNIVGFVDNDPQKAGGNLAGIPIFSFAQISSLKPDYVVVTSQYYEQMLNQLFGLNIPFCHCYDVVESSPTKFWVVWQFYSFKVLYSCAKRFFKLKNNTSHGILHIMPKGGFAESFRTMLKSDHSDHRFIFHTAGDSHQVLSADSKDIPEVFYESGCWYPCRIRDVLTFAKAIAQSRHVMVHSYFNVARFPFILDPELNKNASWVAWGRDIHVVPTREGFIEEKISASKGMFQNLITFMEYDFIHASKRYLSAARNFIGFYPNPLKPEYLSDRHLRNKKTHVMVGHSAVEEMHHIPILRAMAQNNAHHKIITPLSYGGDDYSDKVAQEGGLLFDDYFALKTFMAPADYGKWISTINVAVMHTTTQIALSTMYALLYTGATLYINRQNKSLWAHLTERYGMVVMDSNLLLQGEVIQLLTEEQRIYNRQQATRFFDLAWIAKQWAGIFNEVVR